MFGPTPEKDRGGTREGYREEKSGAGGPVNGFGIGRGGDALFRGGTWTPWSSVFVGLIGAAGLWLGVAVEKWVIVAFSGAVTLVAVRT
ncbi:hypothetical protein ABT075_04035 [Streptomyces sp. NPDC002677]|uniref:hypothetical protein n=1 Tax=Streptomyces sp. NPDC002677 TaxID=3154774 RepID=UPI00331FAA60